MIEVLPKRLESKGTRLHSAIRAALVKLYGAVDLGPVRTPGGQRPRLMAINGKFGLIQNMEPRAIGAMYEADKAKAGKGETIDPDAGSEFNDDADEV